MYRSKELYNEWNELKQDIHFQENNQITKDMFINEWEIWYTSLWLNIGFEENGKKRFRRPVLVIKKVGILFFVSALTSKGKEKNRFYHKLENVVFNKENEVNRSFVILSQSRTLDRKRFLHKIWDVEEKEFIQIKQKLRELLL